LPFLLDPDQHSVNATRPKGDLPTDGEFIRHIEAGLKRWHPVGACEFHSPEKARYVKFPPAAEQGIFMFLVYEAGLTEEQWQRRIPMQCVSCNYAVAFDLGDPLCPIVLPWKVGEDLTFYPANDYVPAYGPWRATPHGAIQPTDPVLS
jgi:hypothetical protein